MRSSTLRVKRSGNSRMPAAARPGNAPTSRMELHVDRRFPREESRTPRHAAETPARFAVKKLRVPRAPTHKAPAAAARDRKTSASKRSLLCARRARQDARANAAPAETQGASFVSKEANHGIFAV